MSHKHDQLTEWEHKIMSGKFSSFTLESQACCSWQVNKPGDYPNILINLPIVDASIHTVCWKESKVLVEIKTSFLIQSKRKDQNQASMKLLSH